MMLWNAGQISKFNAATFPIAETIKTLPSTTQSMTVTNMSAYALQIKSDHTSGFGTLPPMASKTYAVTAGQQVTFTVIDLGMGTIQLAQQYIEYTESTILTESGITALALLPVYTNVVDIGNTPQVQLTGQATVNIANVPTVNVGSGLINATIQNASINTQSVNTFSAPAYIQESVGAFDTLHYFNVNYANAWQNILDISVGGYIKKMVFEVASSLTSMRATASFQNGGSGLFNADVEAAPSTPSSDVFKVKNFYLDFGTGIKNNGITMLDNTLNSWCIGYFLLTQFSGATVQKIIQ